MSQILDILPGWKTYGAAVGLLGLAVYQLSIEQYEQALASAVAAVGLIFARRGATRDAEKVENQLWSVGGKVGPDTRD